MPRTGRPFSVRMSNCGELGWVFDNEADTLALDARFMGFDMTEFLENDAVRPPLMSYLFHRLDDVIDGNPVIIDIDEKTLAKLEALLRPR